MPERPPQIELIGKCSNGHDFDKIHWDGARKQWRRRCSICNTAIQDTWRARHGARIKAERAFVSRSEESIDRWVKGL